MKKDISLVVFDLDNTLVDSFSHWGACLDHALDKLSRLYEIPKKQIEREMKDNTPEELSKASTTVVGRNMRENVSWTPCLSNPTQQQKIGLERILHEWDKEMESRDKFVYKGAVQMLQKIKKSGAKIALYTDAKENELLLKLAQTKLPLGLFDKVYAQENTARMKAMPVKSRCQQVKETLGDRLVIPPPPSTKPNPEVLKKIMADMNATPEKTVMVGDNIRSDGGCAVPIGVDFAWQKQGTVLTETTKRLYEIYNTRPTYKVSTEHHIKQIDDTNRPTVVLEKGVADLSKFYTFVPPKAKTAAQENPAVARRLKNRDR